MFREMSTKQIDISTFYPSAIRTPFLKETTRYWSKRPGRFLYGSTFFLHNTIHIWKNIPSPCGTSDGSQHTEELHNTWRPMAADRGCPLDARGGMSGYNVVILNVYYSVCRFLRIHTPYTLKTPYINFEKELAH
jgi:hypothetical protein